MTQTAPREHGAGWDNILLRTTGWGTAAALALGALVFAAQSETGSTRLQLALQTFPEPAPQPVVAVARSGPGPALSVIEAQVDRLISDREQLNSRLATLEQGLQDVTGSIRRQEQRPEPGARAPGPPFIEPPVIPAPETLPPPTVAVTPPTAATQPARTAPAASSEPARANAQSMDAHSSVNIPLPGGTTAPTPHAQFGVELGTAPDMDALRARWVAVKANFGPLLVGLNPVAVRDHRSGNTSLRLIAGPLPSMAVARELCTKFIAGNGRCVPTRVDAAEIVQR